MKRTIFLISLFIHVFFSAKAQISTNEEPISFQEKTIFRSPSQDIRTMPALNMNIIEQEDMRDEANGIPPRFGYPHKVSFNMQNSGNWQELSNGDKFWQLTVRCPQALSINLLYDKFWLPEGGKFFIYTTDRKHSIGAFTSVNNKGDRSNVQGFATGLLYGDEITLEYYQPRQVSEQAIISVAYVVQGYRYIELSSGIGTRALGSSGRCNVNINCPEGQGWQQEKNAVALILVNGNRYCTGSLINTTANDNRPLFLTADHCLGGWGNNYVKYDAINNSNLSHWSFYWHYEAPECDRTSTEPPILSTSGATVVANNSVSDFALLRLTEDPRNRQGVTPYYLGWDRSGNSGTSGVGIHHPSGDIKKISTYRNVPISTAYESNSPNNSATHWRITWSATETHHGVTEGGSSGSPLLNNDHRVIGQLHGGLSSCSSLNSPDWYGKFSVSWTGNGVTDSRRRLRDWLDPQGTNPQTLDGIGRPTLSGPAAICNQPNYTYTISNLPQGATVQWSASNNSMTLQSGQGTATAVFRQTGIANGEIRAAINFNGTVIANLVQLVTICQPSLSGPTSVCDQATYTVENLPQGATVQWSASNNSMTLQSGQGTGNVIFSGSGEGNILAQILLQGNLLMELNQNITFYNNIPSAPNLVCNFGNTLYPNTTYMLQASSNRAKSFEWTVIGDAYFLDNGSQSNHVYTSNGYISFTTGSGNSGMTNLIKIRCIAHNPCGGSQAIIEKFSFISQYSPFTLSPNPATDVVTVQLNEAPAPQTSQGLGKAAVWPSGVCEIQLWSATSMLRSYKTDRRVFEIPVSELPAGIYFVRIIDKDGKIYTEKLIKK